MKHVFDFGVSQEDFKTEQAVLEIAPGDRILSVASGGEVALNLLCSNNNVSITAVDISIPQLFLARLKLSAAIHLNFPENGYFLGYGKMKNRQRLGLFKQYIYNYLDEDEQAFWNKSTGAIEQGVVNVGRFELYVKKLRAFASLAIGKSNVEALINCTTTGDQEALFDKKIASRKAVQYLFKIAFHPRLYKNRGLSSTGLMHANNNTGERYFNSFRQFCTGTLAGNNFFLQYFLLGECKTLNALPEYLHDANRMRLKERIGKLTFQQSAVMDLLKDGTTGLYNKVHLSNIGDWLNEDDFKGLLQVLKEKLEPSAKLCYRYLQKNQLDKINDKTLLIQDCISLQERDRFPFYSTLSITIK